MSTQGKAYGHATALVRQTLEQEFYRIEALLGTHNPTIAKNIGYLKGDGGVAAMTDLQLSTYVDLLHRSLPIHLQGISPPKVSP